MKKALLIFILITGTVLALTIPNKFKAKQAFDFHGLWIPIKWKGSEIIGLSNKEVSRLMKLSVTLNEKSFILFEDKSINPKYTIHKEKTSTFFYEENLGINPVELGLVNDSIEILTVDLPPSDPMPSIDFIINRDEMIVDNDGVFFFLEKKKIINRPIQGDTVRCLVHETRVCTGYVIQGTRKKGKIIHVKPRNKNVPLELK